MILAWVLLGLSLVAAFPKGYNRGHTNQLQGGSDITSLASGNGRPVPMSWNPFLAFKKSSRRRLPLESSVSTVQAANTQARPWKHHGKGHGHVDVIPVYPWIVPVHGHHHLPTHRIIVLTGNNVISLHPKGTSSSEGTITQVFVTSGNNGITLHSSGCSLEHGCKGVSSSKFDLSKLRPSTELELGWSGIQSDEKLAVEAVLSDIIKLVKEEDLIFDHDGVSGAGSVLESEVVPSIVLVENVIKDAIESEAEKDVILELGENFIGNLEVAVETGLGDAVKLLGAIEVVKDLSIEGELEKTTDDKLQILHAASGKEAHDSRFHLADKEEVVEEILRIPEHLKEEIIKKVDGIL